MRTREAIQAELDAHRVDETREVKRHQDRLVELGLKEQPDEAVLSEMLGLEKDESAFLDRSQARTAELEHELASVP